MKSVLSVDRIGGEGLSTDNTDGPGKLLDIFHHEGHEEHEEEIDSSNPFVAVVVSYSERIRRS